MKSKYIRMYNIVTIKDDNELLADEFRDYIRKYMKEFNFKNDFINSLLLRFTVHVLEDNLVVIVFTDSYGATPNVKAIIYATNVYYDLGYDICEARATGFQIISRNNKTYKQYPVCPLFILDKDEIESHKLTLGETMLSYVYYIINHNDTKNIKHLIYFLLDIGDSISLSKTDGITMDLSFKTLLDICDNIHCMETKINLIHLLHNIGYDEDDDEIKL